MKKEIKISQFDYVVHKNLSEYLGSDIDELIDGDYAFVFGGAVRDAMWSDKINDIDILVMSNAYENLVIRLFWVRNLGQGFRR